MNSLSDLAAASPNSERQRRRRGRKPHPLLHPACLRCSAAFKPGARARPGPEGRGTLCEACWGKARPRPKPRLPRSFHEVVDPASSQLRPSSQLLSKQPVVLEAAVAPVAGSNLVDSALALELAQLKSIVIEQADELARVKSEMERMLDDIFDIKNRFEESTDE